MTRPTPDTDPRDDWIDVEALARRATPLAGVYALPRLTRLLTDAPALAGVETATVRWQAQAEWRDPPAAVAAAMRALAGGRMAAVPRQLWLRLQIEGAVPLVCQRCLEPYWQPLQVDRWFRFVADEATAEAEDETCEEDLLVLEGARHHLLALVEDELLLAAPLVPMHAACPRPLPLAAGDTLGTGEPGATGELAAGGEPAKPHPFAALAALKLRRP